MIITWKNFFTETLFLLPLLLQYSTSIIVSLYTQTGYSLNTIDSLPSEFLIVVLLYSIINSVRIILWNKTNLRFFYIMEVISTSIFIYLLFTKFSFLPAQDEPDYLRESRLNFISFWYSLSYIALGIFFLNLVIKLGIYFKQRIR
jgi:hypothetical protein